MKNFLASEDAVSTALGFFLITCILVIVFSIFMATQVPQWTKEFEAEHADKVPLDFADFASEIDMAILREDTEALTECGIGMKPGALPLLGIHTSGGTLQFNDSSERFSYVACAPGDVAPPGDIRYWNSTPSDFLNYDKFHVAIHDYGAELALELGEDKTIERSHEYLAGTFRFNHFVVTKSSKLHTSDLIIYARNITVEWGAEINADGGGSAGGIQDKPGKGGGPGQNNAGHDSAGGGGAGHNGIGGQGGASIHGAGGAGGPAYEDKTDDTMALAGSGGGGGSTGELIQGLSQIIAGEGGNGGGSILLHAPVINIAGKLSVNGANGDDGGGNDDSAGGGGGGGSGGCILLKGDNVTVSGTGKLYAKGANGGDGGHSENRSSTVIDSDGGGGGGGSGGIIKIFYDSSRTFTGNGYVKGGNGGDPGGGASANGRRGRDGADGFFDPTGFPIQYSPEVRYYATGYLISNLTSTQGHVGYNNTDDTSLVCYRTMTWDERADEDTDIILKVRTAVDANMTTATPWNECTRVVNGMSISDLPSVSDGHKYIQWRADLITRDLAKTPVLRSVNVSYEYGIPFLVNTSGSVRYSSQYIYLPNFKLIYAHGATLRNQTAGEFMLHSPPISISKQNNVTKLKITAINLTGGNSTFSGGLQTFVKPSYHDSALITGGLNFLNLTINVTTDYPNLWEKWFNDTCEEAGLVYGTDPGEYNISGTGNLLTIAFYGNETRPVNIWLKSAEAKIEIEKKLL